MSGGSASSCWPVCRADGLQGIDSRHSILSYVLQHILLLSLWLSDVLCEVCIMVCFFLIVRIPGLAELSFSLSWSDFVWFVVIRSR